MSFGLVFSDQMLEMGHDLIVMLLPLQPRLLYSESEVEFWRKGKWILSPYCCLILTLYHLSRKHTTWICFVALAVKVSEKKAMRKCFTALLLSRKNNENSAGTPLVFLHILGTENISGFVVSI